MARRSDFRPYRLLFFQLTFTLLAKYKKVVWHATVQVLGVGRGAAPGGGFSTIREGQRWYRLDCAGPPP